ncbi:LytTR family transcriptional regulator DNA-binding domain-containing protein [Bifidobacterium callimiconis]|uniref:LytR/AlgR family response regulator transcription factor n=1 Tax=Bifidobacterium callimiconis TaxID=2306973 RepID=UPI001BDD3725|nr:LytTR family DNA-binding domain-containing protein [Bifidobacterium callimiconis]MBT1177700.1 LytTR family transcriptional regulator DNA-binding domain-containing protein [Bifidobacterium callimiconis]
MISVAVVDDDAERAARLSSMISSFAVSSPDLDIVNAPKTDSANRGDTTNFDLLNFHVTVFATIAALGVFLAHHAVDIAFFNIDAADSDDGRSVRGADSRMLVSDATRLFSTESDTQIMLVSRNAGRSARDSVPLPHLYVPGRMHVLARPVVIEELRLALFRAVWQLRQTRERMIRIDSGNVMHMVAPSEIRYAESHRRVLHVYADEMIETYSTIAEFMALLPSYFLQCHKSYLVNMNYVRLFNGSSIVLTTGEEIPVSQRRRSYAKARLRGYIRGLDSGRK